MQVIWKYRVGVPDFAWNMPIGTEILTVDTQNELPVMWALVNPDAPMELRAFISIPTGKTFDGPLKKYIGTFFVDGLVFHLFEVKME